MEKNEFLTKLRGALASLPEEEIEKTLAYYSEIIGDRMDDGMSEEEVVGSLEDTEVIAQHILQETPLNVLIKEKGHKAITRQVNKLLLILGFPVWLPLLIAAVALVFTGYLLIWVLVLTLYSVLVALFAGGVGTLLSFGATLTLNPWAAVFQLGLGLILIALGLLSLRPIGAGVKRLFEMTKKALKRMKYHLFKKKEAV